MNSSLDTTYPLAKANEESFTYATMLMFGSVLPMTLQVAIELGIFDIIAKAGDGAKLSVSKIAAKITKRNPNAPMMLDRILRLLASHNIVTCLVEGSERVYGLAPVTKYLISNQDGLSWGHTLTLLNHKIFLDCWSQLKEAIIEGGIPFDRAYGANIFDYAALDSEFNEIVNAGMTNHTMVITKSMLEVYKGFDNIEKLVDVGGGLGVNLKAITSKYPNIKGINFDLPHVIRHAKRYSGVELISGNMFESVPKGDAIFLKWILHDWSDDECVTLLKNCYMSIPNKGKVIVVEAVAPSMEESTIAAKAIFKSDILMMAVSPGGKERTGDEFMALATAAGFSDIRFVCSFSIFWVMELYK